MTPIEDLSRATTAMLEAETVLARAHCQVLALTMDEPHASEARRRLASADLIAAGLRAFGGDDFPTVLPIP